MEHKRTPARKKAKELAKSLRSEQPDYHYLKSLFRELRKELDIGIPRAEARLPDVPSEDGIRRFYEAVWKARKFADMVLISITEAQQHYDQVMGKFPIQ